MCDPNFQYQSPLNIRKQTIEYSDLKLKQETAP